MAYPKQGEARDRTKVARFDSPEEYITYLRGAPSRAGCANGYNPSFYGEPWEQALERLANGCRDYVEQAQKIIDKMAGEQIFTSNDMELESNIVGFQPNIGAYLAGQPNHMYNLVEVENESVTTPLTIYIETLVSGGVNDKELIARGIACLGFALAMSNIRPVEVYTICIGHPNATNKTGGIVCRIPSKPIDIERAAYMLCDPSYYRRLAFAAMGDQAGTRDIDHIAWPWHGIPTDAKYHETMREVCDMQPQDVYIPGGYLFDKKMLSDPVGWVKDMIAKHRGDVSEV